MEPIFTLVEYLVGGSVGLLWLIPLLYRLLPLNEFDIKLGASEAAFTLAFAYALGIYLDRTSSFVLNPSSSLKKTSKGLNKLWQRYTLQENKSPENKKENSTSTHSMSPSEKFFAYNKTTKILVHGSEALAQATQVNVGRERIARIMLLNSVAGLIVAIWLARSLLVLHILLTIVALWSLLTWAELQTLSEQFKENAVLEVDAMHMKAKD
jgi:hypothetical protein